MAKRELAFCHPAPVLQSTSFFPSPRLFAEASPHALLFASQLCLDHLLGLEVGVPASPFAQGMNVWGSAREFESWEFAEVESESMALG